jgi:uncharacterized alpha-E superfamily protein
MMLSRVAENLYWLARYVERAENTARLVNVNDFLLLDLPRGTTPGWEPLIAITGSRPLYQELYRRCDERSVVRFLVGDRRNPASILSCLQMAREDCRTVRDILPREIWEVLTQLVLHVREDLAAGLTKGARHAYLRRVIEGSELMTGKIISTMLCDEAYHFLAMGRNIERADMTTRIIDVRTGDLLPGETTELRPFETIQWVSVLKSLSAYQMYRRKMQAQVQRSEVLRFLFLDRQFPRSFRRCLDAIGESLATLKNPLGIVDPLRAFIAKVEATPVEELRRDDLHAFVDALQLGLIELHAQIATTYFLPKQVQVQSA